MQSENVSEAGETNSGVGRSPLSIQSLTDLFFRPSRFFESPARLQQFPAYILVAWASGIAYAFARIDSKLMKADLGRSSGAWDIIAPLITESWLNYWIFALIYGATAAGIIWYLGGWWYQKRLNWSGASNAEPSLVRPIYIYQDFVCSSIAIVGVAMQTVVYGSYAESWQSNDYWSSFPLVFLFWSCLTSYTAATTVFSLSKWKARFWFLILPAAFNMFMIGLIGVLYRVIGSGAGAP